MAAMHALIADLLSQGPVLTDGAWGTQMQARGLALGEFPDAWNLTQPEKVSEVAQAYVDAGAKVILTNTFGSNRIRLLEAGLEDSARQLNEAGARISKEAAAGRSLVFGSIGPSGKLLITGEVTPAALTAAFTEQAQALADGGADALVVETMSDLSEARAAVEAAKLTGLPVVACMVYDSGRDRDRTMMGTTPEQAARGLMESGADIVGANCGQGIAGFLRIAARLREVSGRPVWVKANAGLPELEGSTVVYRTTPDEFCSHVPALLQAGTAFIGGCCGTNPDFIRALASQLAAKP